MDKQRQQQQNHWCQEDEWSAGLVCSKSPTIVFKNDFFFLVFCLLI